MISRTIRVEQVALVPYPSPFLSADGLWDQALADISPLGELNAEEIDWLQDNGYDRLNRTLARAARHHGWLIVDGLEPGFPAGNGVCAAAPYQLDASPGRRYPPPVPDMDPENLSWFMSAAESASVLGGSKGGSPAISHPNELGRSAIAAAIAEAIGARSLGNDGT